MSIWLIVLAVVVLICLSGFFSGSETALTAVSRARMHVAEKAGDARATLVTRLTDRKDRLIGALLLSNNLVNILASALATALFIELFGPSGVAYATILMTVVVVIFAEVLPKSWAISAPDRFALAVAPVVNVVVTVFSPPVTVINAVVSRVLRVFGIDLRSRAQRLRRARRAARHGRRAAPGGPGGEGRPRPGGRRARPRLSWNFPT